MVKGNRRGSTPLHDEDQAPIRLRIWLEENDGLMAGLARLRELSGSDAAVQAVLAVPELARLRLSWELWESIVSGQGDEPEALLLGHIPLATLDQARFALYGEADIAPKHLRVVWNH